MNHLNAPTCAHALFVSSFNSYFAWPASGHHVYPLQSPPLPWLVFTIQIP
jgi:hypothetical protein